MAYTKLRIPDGQELALYSDGNANAGNIRMEGPSLSMSGSGTHIGIRNGNNIFFQGMAHTIGGSNSILSLGTNGDTIAMNVPGVNYQFGTLSGTLNITGSLGVGIASPISELHIYENTATADATTGMTIEQQGTGDAVLQFLLTGVQRWTMGVDNSDADKFKIATGIGLDVTPRITIDITGKVGIGVAAPAEALHINGNIRGSAAGGALRISTASGYVDIGSQNSSWTHFYTDRAAFYLDKPLHVNGMLGSFSGNLSLHAAGVVQATVTTTGRLGIGTAAPAFPIHAMGSIHAELAAHATPGNGGFFLNSIGLRRASNDDLSMDFYAASAWTERFRFYNTGRLGIGTVVSGTGVTAAQTMLDITVPSTGSTLTGTTSYGGIHLRQNAANDNYVGVTASSSATGTQGGILFQGSGAYGLKMHFMTTDSHAVGMKNRMTIDQGGNVGIGKTTPTVALDVVGAITATGAITGNSFSGNGANLTTLSATNISSGTISDLRLSTNVVLLNLSQTFTANNTYSATANLFFAGGTTYKIDTTGSAYFNALQVAGNVTLDGNDYVTFGSAGTGVPTDTSIGTKIKLFGNTHQIGVENYANWYDADSKHKFYTNNGTTTRTLRAEITDIDTHIFTDLNVDKNLEVAGEFKAGINNEFPDPILATKSIGSWVVANGTLTYDSIQSPIGVSTNGSMVLTATAVDGQAAYAYDFDVNMNEWITFSSYAYATTTGKASQFRILWYDASKVFLIDAATTIVSTATAWTRYSITAQAPASARYFRVRVDNDGGASAIMYFSAFQVERGKALTGFKPYAGDKEISLSSIGLHLPSNGAIYSGYNNGYLLKDFGNANVTLSAAGGSLHIGYNNTSKVVLSTALYGVNGTTQIAGTDGTLYYQGANADTRYVTKTTDSLVTSRLRMEGATAQLFVANQQNLGANPTVDLAIGDADTGFDWVTDGKLDFKANGVTVASMGVGGLFDFKVAPTLNGTKIWHEGNDGTGSTLDADFLDGLHASSFMRRDAVDTVVGRHSFYSTDTTGNYINSAIEMREVGMVSAAQSSAAYAPAIAFHWSGRFGAQLAMESNGVFTLRDGTSHAVNKTLNAGGLQIAGVSVWHPGNDGAGSGLDADTLDTKHAADFLNIGVGGAIDVDGVVGNGLYVGSVSAWTNKGPAGHNGGALLTMNTHPGSYFNQLWFDTSGDNFYHRSIDGGVKRTWAKVWTSTNDGTGSTLDADLLDGVQGASYLRNDISSTFTGTLTLVGTLTHTGNQTTSGSSTSGSLVVTGNATVGGTLGVTGLLSGSTMNVTGAVTFGSTVSIAGALTGAAISGTTANFTGNSTFGGTLGITGALTAAAISGTTATFSSNGTITGTLGVTGALTAGGITTSTLIATGNTTVGGTLNVTGTLTGAAITGSAITASGALQGATVSSTGLLTTGGLTLSSGVLVHTTADSYDKIRLSDSSLTAIGLKSATTYGYVTTSAMSFTMPTVNTDGFVWRASVDPINDAAMSLTTNGKLYVKDITNVGSLNVRGTSTLVGAVGVTGVLTATTITASATVTGANVTTAGTVTGGTITTGGTLTAKNIVMSTVGNITHNTDDSYDKIRVYNSALYTIGFKSGLTFGYIVNDYAMTFTMNSSVTRGFLWRDDLDTASDGAMSLTTDGRLYVKDIGNVGSLNVRGASALIGAVTLSNTLALNGIVTDNRITTGNKQLINTNGTSIYVGNPSTQLVLESSGNVTANIGGVVRTLYHTGNFDPASKADASTTYSITQVNTKFTDLLDSAPLIHNTLGKISTALSSKSDTTHNHTLDALSNTAIVGKAAGHFLEWNGTAWINNVIVSGDLPDATTSFKGAVVLNTTVTSTSTTQAATASTVKTAYDVAAAALPRSGGTMTGVLTLVSGAGVRSIQIGTYDSIGLISHANNTWLRNSVGEWSYQAGTVADDWTATFQLFLPIIGAVANNQWAELGQRRANAADGRYKGVRITKYEGNAVKDGDLLAGSISANQVDIKSTATANKFTMEYNETEGSLDFIFS